MCLVVSALCTNLDDDFFPSSFSARADLALDALYARQSLQEGHHCFEAIALLRAWDVALFWTLDESALEEAVDLVIDLLLALDPQRHFAHVHEFRTLVRSGDFSLEDDTAKFMLLKTIMKCAALGRLARPDVIAHNYIKKSVEDFAKRAPLEKLPGLVFTSPARNRGTLDVDRSAPVIFDAVFRPLFEAYCQLNPSAGAVLAGIKANEAKWWAGMKTEAPPEMETEPEPEVAQEDEKAEELLGPDTLMEKE
jgi:hypothetical protein